MKKIPTVFIRDWAGTLGPPARYVLDEPHPDCGWVFAGEGFPTRKIDGTCCLVEGGKLFKRHEVKPGKLSPPDFRLVAVDDETQKQVGWVPVGDGPEDKWHRAAWEHETDGNGFDPDWTLPDGTYELVGPHVQGNPEGISFDYLWSHDDCDIREEDAPPRDYAGLDQWLADHDVEGVVWHHPDGRMAKIKGKDFGVTRGAVKVPTA